MSHGAVLVNLTIRTFGNEKTDKRIVQQVAQSHNASFSRDRYLKKILPPAVLAPLEAQASAIRAYHYRVTAPWFDRGIRMMKSSFIIPYKQEIDRLRAELDQMVSNLIKDLPKHEAEARRTRGSLFDGFPSAEHIRRSYGVDIELLPIPMEEDFRIDYISQKERDALTENNKKRFQAQTLHLIDLIYDPLSRMQKSMSNLERTPKIHETTIDFINWWCDHVKELLVDESKLEDFQKIANDLKLNVTQHFNPEGRPKFDPMALEGALDCIERTLKEFECLMQPQE